MKDEANKTKGYRIAAILFSLAGLISIGSSDEISMGMMFVCLGMMFLSISMRAKNKKTNDKEA